MKVPKQKHLQSPTAAGPRFSPSGDALVNISRHIIPGPSGTSQIQYTLSLNEAPVPTRRYSADAASVECTDGVVRLIFVQSGLRSPAPRTALVIRMYPEAVRRVLKTTVDFMPGLREFLERNQLSKAPLLEDFEEPAHLVIVDANLATLGYTGREAEFSFYHIAPMALHRSEARKHDDVELDPVVRVDCSTIVLASVLEWLIVQESQLPGDVV